MVVLVMRPLVIIVSYHGNVVVIIIQLYGVFLIYSGGVRACYIHTCIYI